MTIVDGVPLMDSSCKHAHCVTLELVHEAYMCKNIWPNVNLFNVTLFKKKTHNHIFT